MESVDHFGSMVILTILSLPVHEHQTSFHLFVWKFLSSVFLVYRSLISMVNFIPKYFNHVDVIVNGIVFISFLDSLFLVHRNFALIFVC